MINLKKISMSNFLSFGQKPTVVDLSEKTDTLIIGDNKDIGDEGESRNGAGKTSALQAVIYALYGKGIDKLKADEFINLVNGKKMVVELDFSLAGKDYRIKRGRKPNIVEFYEVTGGEETSLTLDSMKNTDALIEKTINIPYDIFIGVYFLSPHKEAFMAMGAAEQRKFIESVLSLDVLAERAEKLKLIRKDLQTDIKLAQRDLENVEEHNDSVTRNIDRLHTKSEAFVNEKEDNLRGLKELLDDLMKVDFENQKHLIEKMEQQKQLIVEIDSEIREIQDSISQNKITLSRLQADKSQLDSAKSSESSHFDALNDRKDEVIGELDQFSDIEDLENMLEEIKQSEVATREYKEEFSVLDGTKKTIKRDLEQQKKMVEKLTSELESLKEGTCPYCKQDHYDISIIENIEEDINGHKGTILDLEGSLTEIQNELDSVVEKITEEENKTWDFTETQITDVLSKVEKLLSNLENIEERLSEENPFSSTVADIENKYDQPITDLIAEIESMNEALEDSKKSAEHSKKQASDVITETEEDIIFHTVREVDNAIDEYNRTEQEIEKITEQKKNNPYTEELEEAKKSLKNIDKVKDVVSEIESDIKHVGYLITLLTDSKSFVRKNIVDQYIPFLNKRINGYCTRLGLPHIVEIKSDLSTTLTYATKGVSYYNLSQGERMRLNVATTLAFKDLMGMLGKSCNMMLLDEVLDSALDKFAVRKAFELVKSCADTVWIISHREEFMDIASRVMVVTKSNTFSSVSFK